MGIQDEQNIYGTFKLDFSANVKGVFFFEDLRLSYNELLKTFNSLKAQYFSKSIHRNCCYFAFSLAFEIPFYQFFVQTKNNLKARILLKNCNFLVPSKFIANPRVS